MKLENALKILLLSLVAIQQIDFSKGSRILAAFFFPARSHFMMTHSIIRELVKRGHEVTFITPVSLAHENLGQNYTEVLFDQYAIWPVVKELTNTNSVLEMTDVNRLTFLRMVYLIGTQSTDFAFEQPAIQAFINAKDKVGKYDLLLAEQFRNEGALIMGHLYKIPIITVSTFGHAHYLSGLFGSISPWSYVPHLNVPYTDRMTLWERIENVVMCATEEMVRKYSHYPQQDAILKKHFSKLLDRVPSIRELERNVSAILMNGFMPLTSPRPLAYNMILVGGIHIQKPKALPDSLKNFLDGATYGAIYFSLGSQVRSAELPPEKLKIFLDVFGSLKQRVLWKFENESLNNLPTNVMVQRWMPQADILAHPNVKMFLSHGGPNGFQEALQYGVPVLGMPVYGDQYPTINKGKQEGLALVMDYRKFTEKELRSNIFELLTNPKFRNNMKQASKVFRDRPLNAMDTAMYWIDYVIEHRGAPHLISVGAGLTWYQFYLLDIVGLALAVILLSILLLIFICRRRSKTTATSPKRKIKKN
nr:UDP-glycosyltransferase UGT5-like [Drosophila bipectinata]